MANSTTTPVTSASTPSAPAASQDKGKEAEKDKEAKQEVPKVSVNAPDGSEKTLARTTASPPVGGSGFVKVSF